MQVFGEELPVLLKHSIRTGGVIAVRLSHLRAGGGASTKGAVEEENNLPNSWAWTTSVRSRI